MMKTIDEIVHLVQNRQFSKVRSACVEMLHKDRLNAQAWSFLGQAMVGLGNGKMAKLCFDRAWLFDPFATWVERAISDANSAGVGLGDKQVLKLLQVPKVKVAATVLTKNNERTIPACIEALQSSVDEIVVVDTGSTDSTVDLVKAYDVRLVQFEWSHDFSEARNFATSLADADWVIAIDSDEFLVNEDVDSIRTIAGLYDDKNCVVSLIQMNRTANGIEHFATSRMFKKSTGVKWENAIHEEPVPPKGALSSFMHRTLRIRVFHDGYNPQVVDLSEKADRNIGILKYAIEKEPSKPGNYYYLARELCVKSMFDEALSSAEKAKELSVGIVGYPLRPQIYLLLRDIYVNLQEQELVERTLRELTIELPDHPDGWFWLGVHLGENSKTDEAIELLKVAKQRALVYRGPSNFDSTIATWKADAAIQQFRK
ncbi:hypothetical protein AAC03nite_20010 [Alicyclobacillus acidoterrestris]|nr:hypothetical protein AAC03nite_20010 [Alicyclobacillus acidoterrestris]